MSRRLESNVFVDGKWYGPSYPDAGAPPSGVNEKAFGTTEDDDGIMSPPQAREGLGYVDAPPDPGANEAPVDTGADPTPAAQPPPQAGPGSGKSAWLDYAIAHNVRVRDDAPRDDIIAACQAAGVRTE